MVAQDTKYSQYLLHVFKGIHENKNRNIKNLKYKKLKKLKKHAYI